MAEAMTPHKARAALNTLNPNPETPNPAEQEMAEAMTLHKARAALENPKP